MVLVRNGSSLKRQSRSHKIGILRKSCISMERHEKRTAGARSSQTPAAWLTTHELLDTGACVIHWNQRRSGCRISPSRQLATKAGPAPSCGGAALITPLVFSMPESRDKFRDTVPPTLFCGLEGTTESVGGMTMEEFGQQNRSKKPYRLCAAV